MTLQVTSGKTVRPEFPSNRGFCVVIASIYRPGQRRFAHPPTSFQILPGVEMAE